MDDAVRRVAEAVWRAMNAEAMVMSERPRAVNEALNLAESAHSGLGELNVRLETAVAKATTIVLRSSREGAEDLDREFESVITGLSALDEALEDFRA